MTEWLLKLFQTPLACRSSVASATALKSLNFSARALFGPLRWKRFPQITDSCAGALPNPRPGARPGDEHRQPPSARPALVITPRMVMALAEAPVICLVLNMTSTGPAGRGST